MDFEEFSKAVFLFSFYLDIFVDSILLLRFLLSKLHDILITFQTFDLSPLIFH